MTGAPLPFLDELRSCIQARQADGQGLAILLVDCGLIARIDAAWGYTVGDAVRESIIESLRADVLRPDDLVGPMGRDEIACVLVTIGDPAVPHLAAEKILRTLKAPLWIGEDEIFTGASVGVVVFPHDGDAADTLLQRARSASLDARSAPGRVATWSPARGEQLVQDLVFESRLRSAVMDDTLEMTFKPQYDLKLGPIMGAQIGLGWRGSGGTPAGAGISPEQAFATAEAAGHVSALVSSILNRSLRNISEFRYSAGLDLNVCVPLPARALLQSELPEVVQRALGTWRLRAGRLCLQLSGTALLATNALARRTLLELKKLGVRLSINDPQMAITSLLFLATLPFQEILLDVSPAATPASPDGSDAAAVDGEKAGRILGALIELAQHLSLDVVAVGVEDDDAEGRLKALGCEFMQADFKGPALDSAGFVQRYG